MTFVVWPQWLLNADLYSRCAPLLLFQRLQYVASPFYSVHESQFHAVWRMNVDSRTDTSFTNAAVSTRQSVNVCSTLCRVAGTCRQHNFNLRSVSTNNSRICVWRSVVYGCWQKVTQMMMMMMIMPFRVLKRHPRLELRPFRLRRRIRLT